MAQATGKGWEREKGQQHTSTYTEEPQPMRHDHPPANVPPHQTCGSQRQKELPQLGVQQRRQRKQQ